MDFGLGDFGAAPPCSPAERSLSASLPSPLLPTSATPSTFLPEGTSPACDTRPQPRPPDSILTLPLRLPYRGPLELSSRHRASSRRGGPRCAARATSRRCLDRWLARSARKSCPSPSPRT